MNMKIQWSVRVSLVPLEPSAVVVVQSLMCCVFWEAFLLTLVVRSSYWDDHNIPLRSVQFVHSPLTSPKAFPPTTVAHWLLVLFFTPFCINFRESPAWKSHSEVSTLKKTTTPNHPVWHVQPCHAIDKAPSNTFSLILISDIKMKRSSWPDDLCTAAATHIAVDEISVAHYLLLCKTAM